MSAYEGVLQLGDNYLDYYDYEGDPNTVHQRLAENERQLRYQTNPKLASVKGKLPVAQGTRAEFREAARNRDGNTDDSTWRLTDWSLWSAIQLLFLIEYGTFSSQGALAGDNAGGLSNLASGSWAASVSGGSSTYVPIVPTGGTESLGNGSGNVSLKDIYGEGAGLPIFDGANDLYWDDVIPCYRGIESPYGHIWQWLDGIVLDFDTVNRLDAREPFWTIILQTHRKFSPIAKPITFGQRLQDTRRIGHPRASGEARSPGSRITTTRRARASGWLRWAGFDAGVFCVHYGSGTVYRRAALLMKNLNIQVVGTAGSWEGIRITVEMQAT